MYTIYVIFNCFPGKREDFIRRVEEEGVVDAIRAEEGCIRYDYYFSQKDPNEILLIEAWESKEHQQVHLTQPHMDTLRAIKGEHVEKTTLGEFTLQ